jgi:membrane fusion protein (multidrug efflux system)
MDKRTKKTAANIVIIALIIVGIVWIASNFIHLGGEYTDNAQVEQNLVNLNARVQGFVERVYVNEYTHVNKGDTLLVIEDSEYRLHVAQAEA